MNLTKDFIGNIRKEICELFFRIPCQKNVVKCICGQEFLIQPKAVKEYLLKCPYCFKEIVFSVEEKKKEFQIKEYLLCNVLFDEIKEMKTENNSKYERIVSLMSQILFLSKEDIRYFDTLVFKKYIDIFLAKYFLDFKENQLTNEVYKFWV